MTRSRFGSITKKRVVKNGRKIDVWDVRRQYSAGTGADGKAIYKSRSRRCYSYAEAVMVLNQFEQQTAVPETSEHRLFDLCDYFAEHYIKPPTFVGSVKLSGYKRNLKTLHRFISELKTFFGNLTLKSLTYEDIRRYAEHLSRTPTQKGSLPAAATVHQKLSFLRRVLNIGKQLTWLEHNPFLSGPAIIKKTAETKRNRMITFEEEVKLLDACTGRRRHLKTLILLALDTAMRRGEIYRLRWDQINFEQKVIFLIGNDAASTKTGVEGILPLTDRLVQELLFVRSLFPDSVFVVGGSSFKRSFASARKAAGLENLQFRDLRATGATRMMLAGNAGDLVRKITRHTRTEIFLDHYTGVDVENARMIGAKLSDFVSEQVSKVKAKAKV